MKGINGNIKEKALLYRIQVNHDPDAFAELYDAYIQKIYRFVFFKLRNKEEAEDTTSDTFLKAWQYLIQGSEKKIQSFSGLIYQIARNKIVDIYRKRSQTILHPLDEAEEMVADATLAEKISIQIDAEKLVSHIQQLKQEYQEVLLLRYMEDLSIGEIATILGKGKTAIRVTVFRAIKVLRTKIEK